MYLYVYIFSLTLISFSYFICILLFLKQGPISGPETGKRKRVTRKADGKLTLSVSLGGSWHEQLTLLVTHLSLPILAYPSQGH